MPELPEVEHAARSLGEQIAGRQIAGVVHLDWERMVETPSVAEFRALLAGRQVRGWRRRAKWILLELDGGWTLALHLRMSGHITVEAAEHSPDRHTHLVLALDDGRQVFFHDTRKFGRARLLDPAGLAALEGSHGIEPFSGGFTPEWLATTLRRHGRQIKPLLLDQRIIAGIGNIYADEALWRAEIHPLRGSDTLNDTEVTRLHAGIQAALREGLQNGGSTLRDYRNSYGEMGSNQEHFNAYDQQGRPCGRCGALIEKISVGQRGTHFCPECQAL